MKLTLADFSGGIVDTPFNAPENCGEVVDNLIINKDRTIEGCPGADIFSQRIPTNKRISLIKRLADNKFVAFSNGRAFLVTPSSVSEILGPTGNKAFSNGSSNSIVSAEFFNDQLHCTDDAFSKQIKIYLDASNNVQLRTAGLPKHSENVLIDSPVSIGDGTNPNIKNFVYAFTYFYEYNVGTMLFSDESSPTIIPARVIEKTDIITFFSNISNLKHLQNGNAFNYDVNNVVIRIYRTTNNGSVFYYLGDVVNGSTTFIDSVSDTVLVNRPGLYTNGGISGNDEPSPAKHIFECNNTYYTLNIKQGTKFLPYRLKQSITNDPDSSPDDFFVDFKGTLRGGVGIGRSPVVFTESQTVRLDGIIDEAGQGGIQREIISHTVGAASHNGIVRTSKGVYFPSYNDGFYFTDGYSAPTKLAKKDAFSSKIDKHYKGLVSSETKRSRIQGVYDAQNNRVFWTVQDKLSDNDKIYVYDETHDAFTTISSKIMPTAIAVDNEDLIIGDSRGYLFRMSYDFYNFPVVDTAKEPDLWDEEPIIFSWKSIHFDGGDGSINKWFNKINVQGNPETSVSMAIRSYTNGEDTYKELAPIRMISSITWGDFSFMWGDQAFIWDRVSTMNQTRRFPHGRLRARQRQVEFTNAYVEINSNTADEATYVTVNPALGIVTLVDPTEFSFGLNNEGYDFMIDGKSYVISGNPSGDTLKLYDPMGTLAQLESEFFQWTIMGYPKNQRPHILNMSVEFEAMSDAGTAFRKATDA